MAMDFPASPTSGQQYQGYTWNGVAWVGGAPAQGVSNAEQFFDVGGRSTIDIAVPTWAKQALIYTSLWNVTANAQVNMLVSGDGTTFPNAANDYTIAGFTHQSGGTGTYANQAQLNINRVPLNLALNNVSIPNLTEIQITTARGPTFAGRIVSSVYDNTAAVLYAYRFHSFYVNAAMAGATQLKALRIYTDLGTWTAGSNLRVKWIGDLAQQPNGVSIVDAPADGCEYVRVNNLWRLKAQTLVLDGLNTIDVVVPPTARLGRFDGNMSFATSNAANSIVMRGSVDGTNFQSGASDYFYGGLAHYSGSSGYVNLVATNAAYGPLTFASDSVSQPARFQFTMNMARVSATYYWGGTVKGGWYHSPATNLYTDFQFTIGISSALAGLRLQKLRFFNLQAPLFASPSVIYCEWIY